METQVRTRVSREEWAKRVERWRDSGLTSAEFAAEIGINPHTLTYWKWVLGKGTREEKRASPRRSQRRAQRVFTSSRTSTPATTPPEFVEVRAALQDARFELELGSGRRLRVPSSFDAAELRRLLEVLEA